MATTILDVSPRISTTISTSLLPLSLLAPSLSVFKFPHTLGRFPRPHPKSDARKPLHIRYRYISTSLAPATKRKMKRAASSNNRPSNPLPVSSTRHPGTPITSRDPPDHNDAQRPPAPRPRSPDRAQSPPSHDSGTRSGIIPRPPPRARCGARAPRQLSPIGDAVAGPEQPPRPNRSRRGAGPVAHLTCTARGVDSRCGCLDRGPGGRRMWARSAKGGGGRAGAEAVLGVGVAWLWDGAAAQ